MTKFNQTFKAFIVIALMGLNLNVFAQIDNWRAWDQTGVNVFEAPKSTDAVFDGTKVRIGGAFNQQYQSLSHSNDTTGGNQLYDIGPGFKLASANLNIDVQLNDGIRLCVENYMSSQHHTEFWVKGGYIQVDKLPMFGNPQWFTDKMRVKVGQFQQNYGDQQFRRLDNGNGMYNPFVGNYIMDAFATEIGAEFYYFATPEIMLMGGLSNGQLNPSIAAFKDGKEANPSIYLKAAYDKQLNDDTRVRLSASFTSNSGAGRSTLYGGDRTSSAFKAVMALDGADLGSKAFQGRWNPGFSNQITAWQINPFVKVKGLEIFGVIEGASGNNYSNTGTKTAPVYELLPDNKRSVMQIGGEFLYRFLENESAYVGAKYNQVSGQLNGGYKDAAGEFLDVSINRIEVGAGWYATKNLLLKGEYVKQSYVDFPGTTEFKDGMFNGIIVSAVAAF
jgi:hypothetical protein